MATLVATFAPDQLLPWMRPDLARTEAVQMAASLTVAKGQPLAVLAASGKATVLSATVIAPGTGFSLSATGSDGTIPAGAYNLAYTFVNSAGETTISNSVTVTVGSTNHIVVPTVALASGATAIRLYMSLIGTTTPLYFVREYDGTGYNILVSPAASAVTPPTTNSARTATDGSATARYLSRFAFVTDANGMVILGPSGGVVDLTMAALQTIEVWKSGDFLLADLTGYDDGVRRNLGGREFGTTGQASGKWVSIP